MSWWNRAACRKDPAAADAFFPAKDGGTRTAKRICAGCPVREPCLDYALDNGERWGVWGGLSERERRRLKRRSRVA